jgi:hypothetical protein
MPGGGYQHGHGRHGHSRNVLSHHNYPTLPRLETLRRSEMFQSTYQIQGTPHLRRNTSRAGRSNNIGHSNANDAQTPTEHLRQRSLRTDHLHAEREATTPTAGVIRQLIDVTASKLAGTGRLFLVNSQSKTTSRTRMSSTIGFVVVGGGNQGWHTRVWNSNGPLLDSNRLRWPQPPNALSTC